MEKVKEQQQAVATLLAVIGINYGLDKDIAIPFARMIAENGSVANIDSAMKAVDEVRAFARQWEDL